MTKCQGNFHATSVWVLALSLLLFIASACGGNEQEAPVVEEDPLIQGSAQVKAQLDQLTAALAENSEDAALYAQRGKLFLDNNLLDRAIQDLFQSIRYDSSRVEIWHLLADAQMDNRRSRDALNTMIYAGSRFQNRVGTLLKLAEFQLILKKHDDAIATLERAGKLDPNEGEVFFMLGQVLEDQDTSITAEPIQAYERATELNPKIVDAWLSLGRLHERRGNKLAERYFKTAIDIDRTNALPYRSLADYYSRQAKLKEAVAAYDEAIKLDPQYADALYNSGLVLLDMDSVARAQDQFDRAVQVSPLFVEAHYYRGVALELQGKLDAARNAYQQAASMSPQFELAQQALDRVAKAKSKS